MRRSPLAAAALVFAAVSAPRSALAQGENAVAQRPGTISLSIGSDWAHFTERFGTATPTRPAFINGTRELLGVDFSAESLGVAQLPFLSPSQSDIRALTGLGSYALSLGRSLLTLDASVRHQPIRLRWVASRRFGMSVNVPIVRARMSAFLRGPDSTKASQGNVGFSAEYLTPGALTGFRSASEAALAALATVAASGPAALRPQAQAELDALQPLVCGLSNLATLSATTSPCYAPGARPSVLLPTMGSEAGDSITARLTRAQTDYETLRSNFATQGVTLPAFAAAYALPAAPLDSTDLRRFFSDPTGPLAGDSLREVVRTGIGDMEVGGWFQLIDGARWRSQLALMVRLPTGTIDSPDNFIDIGTGDHQTDVEVAWRNDLVFNRNLWLHAGGRYGLQMADQLTRRVTPWYLPFALPGSSAEVRRNLGDYYAIDIVPNWQLDEALGFGIGWHYFHQGAATFAYVDPADEARIGLGADVLGLATSVSRMRVGAGVSFSTLDRFARRQARLPYRISWSYNATFWGRGGQVPKAGVMAVEIQAFFGHLR